MYDRIDALHDRHERPVSLIGWSLGGLYARRLARETPEKVRQVITLGSPLQMGPDDRSAASIIGDRLQHRFDPEFGRSCRITAKGLLPVPSTPSTPAPTAWSAGRAASTSATTLHDNVEVRGSHIGLGFNPAALFVIADRLALPEDRWRPFRPPAVLRPMFPPAESFEPEHRPPEATGAATVCAFVTGKTDDVSSVAFIGLGVMGTPMARHLAAAGHSVTVYNRTPAKALAWVALYGQPGGADAA